MPPHPRGNSGWVKGQLSGQLKLKAPLVGGGRGGGRVQGSKLANSRREVFTKGSGSLPPPLPHPPIPGTPFVPGKQDRLGGVGECEGALRGHHVGSGGGKAGYYPDSKTPAPSCSPLLEYWSGFVNHSRPRKGPKLVRWGGCKQKLGAPFWCYLI